MNIDDAAAREDLVKLVALQLVVAGAAAHHHGLDVEVVERVGNTVKEHPVVGDHLLGLVELAAAALGVAAAQVARRQHGLHARMPQHGLRGQAHLAEQPLRAAAREVEHRLGIKRGGLGVADDRDVILVLNVEQRARGAFGQATGQLFVDEVDHLLLDGRGAHRGGWPGGLLAADLAQDLNRHALGLEAHAHHGRTQQLDGVGVGGVEHGHGQCVAGAEALLAHLAQQVAHVHGHVAKVDLHRAGALAAVAHGAVVGHVFKLLPMLDAHAPARLLFIEESLDQQRGRQDLVARAVQQIGARHMRGAHGFALAAAQAVLHRIGNGTDVALLHDERLVSHQAKAGGVGVGQIGVQRHF